MYKYKKVIFVTHQRREVFKPVQSHTVQTVAADLRRGEHIPKMQNNIGRKSMLRVLRQLRSKDGGGGGGLDAVPGHAARRSAWRCVLHNCREFTFGEFGSGITKNTRRARSTFLQDCNPVLYHLRHTFLMKFLFLTQSFLY